MLLTLREEHLLLFFKITYIKLSLELKLLLAEN